MFSHEDCVVACRSVKYESVQSSAATQMPNESQLKKDCTDDGAQHENRRAAMFVDEDCVDIGLT